MRATALILVALSVLGSCVARADDAPTAYTLELWQSANGQGIARTVGPIAADRCAGALERMDSSHAPVSPDMQLVAHLCVSREQLPQYLAGRNCQATRTAPVRGDVRLWLYGCFVP